MKKKILIKNISVIFVISIFSCKMGKDYSRSENLIDKDSEFINSENNENKNLASTFWWKEIDDEIFNRRVDQLLSDNLTLRQNYVRVLQSQEQTKIVKGGLFPEIGANLNASRNITPVNGIQGFNLGGGGKIYNTNYRAELSTSWQLDLFGKVRRSLEASEAEFEASLNDLQAMQQSLIAQLLQTRISIASNYELLEMAKENLENQSEIYKIVKRRYYLGITETESSDVLLAKENYFLAKNEVENYRKILRGEIYEFDILLGKKPGETEIVIQEFSLMKEPKKAPICLPADLLDRRPDLRASELRLKAANANIGVAIADLYPDFSITANAGYRGNKTSTLINSDQIGSSLAGNIATKLFQGGALRANVRLKKKQAQELLIQYANNLLTAIKEVETALSNEESLQKEFLVQTKTLKSNKKREKIAKNRYEKGIIGLKEYLEIKNQYYQTKKNWISLLQAKWNNRISLYLALGGNWLEASEKNQCGNL